jgi:hypothetical protein
LNPRSKGEQEWIKSRKYLGNPKLVMAGLVVPAIHVFLVSTPQDVDARDKPGHDDL